MIEILGIVTLLTAGWWFFWVDFGYGYRVFMEGATGRTLERGRVVPSLDIRLIEAVRTYFLSVYGNRHGLAYFLLMLRWYTSLGLPVFALLIFAGLLEKNHELIKIGAMEESAFVAVILVLTFIQWWRQGYMRKWKTLSEKRHYYLREVSRTFGGPAPFFRLLQDIPTGTPPSFLDCTYGWATLKISSLFAMPLLLAVFWALVVSEGVHFDAIEASVFLVICGTAQLPILYTSWLSRFSWPGTTGLVSYYPLRVIKRDIGQLR
ncbi:hypothetical protein HAP94_11065 [Acidithiobacillus ferrivorans]|nr:hypothetical protein [Acidithiobacillus ferrivorans]